jgi:hypothetical protein
MAKLGEFIAQLPDVLGHAARVMEIVRGDLCDLHPFPRREVQPSIGSAPFIPAMIANEAFRATFLT